MGTLWHYCLTLQGLVLGHWSVKKADAPPTPTAPAPTAPRPTAPITAGVRNPVAETVAAMATAVPPMMIPFGFIPLQLLLHIAVSPRVSRHWKTFWLNPSVPLNLHSLQDFLKSHVVFVTFTLVVSKQPLMTLLMQSSWKLETWLQFSSQPFTPQLVGGSGCSFSAHGFHLLSSLEMGEMS